MVNAVAHKIDQKIAPLVKQATTGLGDLSKGTENLVGSAGGGYRAERQGRERGVGGDGQGDGGAQQGDRQDHGGHRALRTTETFHTHTTFHSCEFSREG